MNDVDAALADVFASQRRALMRRREECIAEAAAADAAAAEAAAVARFALERSAQEIVALRAEFQLLARRAAAVDVALDVPSWAVKPQQEQPPQAQQEQPQAQQEQPQAQQEQPQAQQEEQPQAQPSTLLSVLAEVAQAQGVEGAPTSDSPESTPAKSSKVRRSGRHPAEPL